MEYNYFKGNRNFNWVILQHYNGTFQNQYLVDGWVAPIRDDTLDLLQLVVLVPHLTAVSDHVGHAGVDDHVAGHVQVRDALQNFKFYEVVKIKKNALIPKNAVLLIKII